MCPLEENHLVRQKQRVMTCRENEDGKRSANFGQSIEKERIRDIAQEEFHLSTMYPKFRVQIDAKTKKGL